MDFTAPDTLTLNANFKLSGYFASSARKKIHDTDSKDWFLSNTNDTDYKVNKTGIDNLGDINEPLKINIESFKIATQPEMIYIQPVIMNDFTENPFIGKKRFLPVELPYEKKYQYVVNLLLPDGYTVVDIPENKQFSLPNNWGIFSYLQKLENNKLQIIVNIAINQLIFPRAYYQKLGEFYSIISEKINEQVVLKKVVSAGN